MRKTCSQEPLSLLDTKLRPCIYLLPAWLAGRRGRVRRASDLHNSSALRLLLGPSGRRCERGWPLWNAADGLAELLLAHFLPGNGFDRAGIELRNAPLDLLSPCGLDLSIRLGFQRLNEQPGQRRPVALWQLRRFAEDFFEVFRMT